MLSWGSQSAALPSPVTQNLIFTDNTYDIGASGATRPRNYFGAGNMIIGGTLSVTGASTITSLAATSGSFSTTLSVTGASTLAAVSATSGSFSSIITATGAITSSGGLAGTNGTFSGLLSVSGFGTHAFSSGGTGGMKLTLTNVSTGAGDYAEQQIINGTTSLIFDAFNQNWSTSGVNVQAGVVVQGTGAGGMSVVASHGSGVLRFYSGGTTLRAQINTDGTQTWAPYGAGTATFDSSGNITSVSDERMKDIQGPFTAGLSAVLGIRPIRFRYNKASGLEQENIYAGFSAQNVMAYIPEAVGKNMSGIYSLNMVPVLAATVTAMQELTREVDELRAALNLTPRVRTVEALTDEARIITSMTPSKLAELAKKK